jgi:hypothetical protein
MNLTLDFTRLVSIVYQVVSCERALMAAVDVRNCIKFYTTADEIGALELKDHCSQLISAHWVIYT